LRKPSPFAVRLVVALLLIVGGLFSFLPILGLWMLPLGLLFIAQDVPLLQKTLSQSVSVG
jgi:asparagine N-glycosylation enzyme membrane subunit Stt3